MRIGIVTQRVSRNDGQGRVNLEIAAEALRQGHQVRLFCEQVDGSLIEAGAQAELMPNPRLVPSRLFKDQFFAWRTNRRLAGGAGGCDVLLANGFATWARSDVNAVHFVHRTWFHSPFHPWRQKRAFNTLYPLIYTGLNMKLEQDAFRRSGAIVAVSNAVRRELIEVGVPAAKITTILNGVSADEFQPGMARRERFGLPNAVPIALFAGDLKSPRKNLDTVLRALVTVPGLHLAVAGRHDRTPWPGMASRLGIVDRVHFVGFQEDMPELMRASDLFVFPSRYEPFGLVILEALACGLPVVTAKSAGAADIITSEVGIALDDSEDVEGLSAALKALASNPGRRKVMADAARRLGLDHSWPAMARDYLRLLEEAHRTRRKV